MYYCENSFFFTILSLTFAVFSPLRYGQDFTVLSFSYFFVEFLTCVKKFEYRGPCG
jgi:hypothetical protein